MAFTDIMGQYMDRRLGDIQDRYNQVGGLLSGDQDAWAAQFGLESEEEKRKRRERELAAQQAADAANAVVQTTKVETYGDGSQTETIKREIAAPAAETPAPQYQAPEQPAVQAPMVAPAAAPAQPQLSMAEQERQRIMAERGMPAGPAAPVAPAQPTPAPAPQPQAAAPAPMAPVAPTPQPQAAAPAPAVSQMPAMPQPGPGVQVAGPMVIPPAPQPQAAPAAAPAAAAPVVEAAPERTYMDDVAEISQDPIKLFEYANREGTPREGRLMAAKLAKQHMSRLEDRQRADDVVNKVQQTGDTTDLERILRSKKDEGSYLKAILFARLGLNKLAEDEQAKLGAGNKWLAAAGPSGERALVQYDANGLPISGLDVNGRELSTKELAKFSTYAGILKGANVGSQIYRDPGTGQTLTKVDTQQGPIYYNKAGDRVVPKGEPVPLTAGSDIATQLQLTQMRRQQQFVGQTASARLRAYQETNNERAMAGLAPLTPEQMGINANGELIGQPQPGMPATPPAPGAPGAPAVTTTPAATATPKGPVAPAEMPAATPMPQATTPVATTGAALRTQRLGREKAVGEVAKVVGGQVAASADTQNMLNSIDKIVTIIDSGNTNLGHAAGGVLAGGITGETAQRWGERLRTQDARNTKLVMDTVNKLAADGLKALGSNPSTVDLEFWTKYKPDINSDPEFVKQWLQSRSADLKRRLGYAEQQMGVGGTGGAAPAVTPDRTTTRPTVSNW